MLRNLIFERSSAGPGIVTHEANAPDRCVSVPFPAVSTYIERRDLQEELKQKLSKPHPGYGLAYAVAVTGLGGTGRTQLALRYLKEHGGEYDMISRLDARMEETAQSSFERCCTTLRLPYRQYYLIYPKAAPGCARSACGPAVASQ